MNEQKIIIQENNELKSYMLFELDNLELFVLEIKGQFYSGRSMATKQGENNFLKIEYQGAIKEYQFLLERENVSLLNAVLLAWTQSSVNFVLHNETSNNFTDDAFVRDWK
ncbi:hypothetical protein GA0116948_107190 [Chitinophaga costaii]|uniref:Uncharacterized protein n=1 Tax=Chitinophaga costaii TaxID=1335309 RepID=A0A1C4E9U3_9BACT|nr:hypothetical protein [Chitinophaga costaii]PUZ24228.1 hypothetical protein DCM91_12385 [Chitinophaga costaii]SCC40291.1 hypothetical protein GA0116948_107190 [Chitinophaga costaii]